MSSALMASSPTSMKYSPQWTVKARNGAASSAPGGSGSGSVEVGTKELFEIAQQLEGLTALGTGNDHSQRTRLGKALGRIRDRVFDLGDVKLRVCAAGLSHQANRWRLSAQERPRRLPRTRPAQALEETHERLVGNVGRVGNVFRLIAACGSPKVLVGTAAQWTSTLPTLPTLPSLASLEGDLRTFAAPQEWRRVCLSFTLSRCSFPL